MFLKVKQDLGVLKAGSDYRIDFPYENIDLILRTEASCDCTRVNNFTTEQKINVVFHPKFPGHLKAEGKTGVQVERKINVYYRNKEGLDQSEILIITATITS